MRQFGPWTTGIALFVVGCVLVQQNHNVGGLVCLTLGVLGVYAGVRGVD